MKIHRINNIPVPHIGMRIWKTVIAVFLSALSGYIFNYNPFYTIITAILCMQVSTEASLKTAGVRCIGTFIGGIFSALMLVVINIFSIELFSIAYYMIISLFVAPMIYITVLIHREKSAFITCVVFFSVVLVNIVRMNPYLFIVLRVIETLAGIGISVAVNMIIKNPDKKNSGTV